MTPANRWALVALVALPAVSAAQRSATAVAYTSSVSSRDASIEFQLSNGSKARIALEGGKVLVDGKAVGSYRIAGDFERSFRALLSGGTSLSAGEMLAAMKAWKPAGIRPEVAAIPQAIQQRLQGIEAAPAAPVPPGPPVVSGVTPPPAALAPSVAPQIAEAVAQEVARAVPGRLSAPVSAWAQIGHGIASLLGAFAALAALGFGFTYFAPRQLEVVADTAIKSFSRSFFTGLFAQPLVPVVFGLLMLGLALTIVGIITLPVAAVAALAVLVVAGLGGYLALARAAGELYLRRRMALGTYAGSPDAFRFLIYGVGALLMIWAPAALFSWIPVAGPAFVLLASLVTWGAATVGFGAVILSRGGVVGTFGRPAVLELTDEHLWAARSALPATRSPRSLT